MMMTEATLYRPEVFSGFSVIFQFCSLAWVSTGFTVLSSTNSDTGTGEMSLLGASSLSRTEISSTVGEESEDEEDEEE